MASLHYVSAWLQARTNSDRGASLVEYALLVALIAVVCIAAISFLGDAASEQFDSVGGEIQDAGS